MSTVQVQGSVTVILCLSYIGIIIEGMDSLALWLALVLMIPLIDRMGVLLYQRVVGDDGELLRDGV